MRNGSLQVAQLVSFVRQRAVELEVNGEQLRFRGALGKLPPAVRRDLVERKGEILRFLATPDEAEPEGPLAPLWRPLALGTLELPNRVVMSPMEVDFGDPGGIVSSRAVDYYAARARGGAGLVVVEATCVDAPAGRLAPTQLVADQDAALPGLRRLARAIQGGGARAALQLQHAGRKTSAALTGVRPVAPSAIPNHLGETPRELEGEEILALARRFADAAARAQIAGFDAVEIHAGHGYLQAQFLSPTYNRRDDDYGGSVANRARFLLETLRQIRRRVGDRYPVLCRLSAVELEARGELRPLAEGLRFEETLAVARRLEEAGISAIDLSATLVGTAELHPMAWPEGALVDYGRRLKGAVGIPVSLTSRVPPELAAARIAGGDLDLVRLGRPLLADPDLPRKLAAGREGEIRPCIYCSECLDGPRRQAGAVCAVNPRLGREGEAQKTASVPRTVVVAGGGPAGMETAVAAARRGHRVVLFERQSELGGQLRLPSKPRAAGATYGAYLDFQRSQVERSAVQLRLGEELSPDALADLGADVLVLATGARGTMDLPAGAAGAVSALEVLKGAPVGERVAVIGGGLVGCETALKLASDGHRVTLVHRGGQVAPRVAGEVRTWLLWALEKARMEIRLETEARRSHHGEVTLRRAGEESPERFDTVCLAVGAQPDLGPFEGFRRQGLEVVTTGDCRKPRDLRQAIHDGFWAAQRF